MHALSALRRDEFLATPQLIRFDYAVGGTGFQPTFLVKANSLLLKYIVQGVAAQLIFSTVDGRLLYAIRVFDDEVAPAVLWSILESDAEMNALRALVMEKQCPVFLFNELAVNVASSSVSFTGIEAIKSLLDSVVIGPVDYEEIERDVSPILDRLDTVETGAEKFELSALSWVPVVSRFITSHAGSSVIDLFSLDEGAHQEQLAIWLTDNLQPRGVFHSPQIPKGTGSRELTDVLLSHEYGSVLIESKTLTIFNRNSLPSRTKLANDVGQHILKAVSQLRGAMRQLKIGAPVRNRDGVQVDVERSYPMHGVVLIPDLRLVVDRSQYGLSFIAKFTNATGGFLHLLDISELLRIVQAAEMIAAKGERTTPMMAFDYYLLERAKTAIAAESLCIEVLLRFSDEQ